MVLRTLHTNDSPRVVSRLISTVVEPYLLGDALAMSQAQRIFKKLSSHCKRGVPVSNEIQDLFHRNGIIYDQINEHIYEADGFEECGGSGFLGGVAIMEMCPVNEQISKMISCRSSMCDMRKEAAKQQVLSLNQEGMKQVILGNTTLKQISKLSHFGAMQ